MFFEQETIGQYIGRKDKKGEKLFQGDICKIEGADVAEDEYFVITLDEFSRYILERPAMTFPFTNVYPDEVEKLGNIYDNPELMKSTTNNDFVIEKGDREL